MKKIFSVFGIFISSLFVMSCGYKTHDQTSEQRLTLGVVQKEIKVGMSQAEVVEVLGSPNIVTTDAEGNETWVYDRIATHVKKSEKGFGVFLIPLAGETASSEQYQSQRTITVVIKFDKDRKVKDVKYHVTKF